MPPLVAVFIGGIFALVGLFMTNLFYRRVPFWLPVVVAISLGLLVGWP